MVFVFKRENASSSIKVLLGTTKDIDQGYLDLLSPLFQDQTVPWDATDSNMPLEWHKAGDEEPW